jgi:6-pyruvoyltetrahydropterin/6-carboxytetrahydropterin synthase
MDGLEGFENEQGAFCVSIEGRFEAAHYLYAYFPDGSDEDLHGHSWSVHLTLARKDRSVDEKGISLDFITIRNRLDELINYVDHTCLNELPEFAKVNPTAENVARLFSRGLHKALEEGEAELLKVVVYEGPSNAAVFEPVH